MDTENGRVFIKNLAHFIKLHEKALANAFHQRQKPKSNQPSSTRPPSPITPYPPPSTSSSLVSSLAFFTFSARHVKPAKLTLTPHHLFYLLTRFQELGVSVGSLDTRLENLRTDSSPANYVSFLNQAQRNYPMNTDHESIYSVSSIRSVMSSMSSLWTKLELSSSSPSKLEAKLEKQKLATQEDLRYLFSSFTKVPCLRLSPDYRAPLITGFEEFPFDTAVPLLTFKNVTMLEISDVNFRQIYGWDRISEQLRSLTLKRASVQDPADLLVSIILDDMDKRRRRSVKGGATASTATDTKETHTPRFSWSGPSPIPSPSGLSRSQSDMIRPHSLGSSEAILQQPQLRPHLRQMSLSPQRPCSSKQALLHEQNRRASSSLRHSSSNSSSTNQAYYSNRNSTNNDTPRGSSSNLLLSSFDILPSSKWRFLMQLSLADNSLTSIPILSFASVATTLQYLDISSNLFTEIPAALSTLVSLRALNLSNCMITSLHSLNHNPLAAITILNLRGNRICSIAGSEGLLSLQKIDLRENLITDLMEMARLTGTPGISAIYISRNPFTKYFPNYRINIFNLFRNAPGFTEDISIDQQGPSYSERKQLVTRVSEYPNPPAPSPVAGSIYSPCRPSGYSDALLYNPVCYEGQDNQVSSLGELCRKNERGPEKKKKQSRRTEEPIGQMVQPKSKEAKAAAITTTHLTRKQEKKATTDQNLPTPPLAFSQTPQVPQPSSLIDLGVTLNEEELFKREAEKLRTDFATTWLSSFDANDALGSSPVPLHTVSQPFASVGAAIGQSLS